MRKRGYACFTPQKRQRLKLALSHLRTIAKLSSKFVFKEEWWGLRIYYNVLVQDSEDISQFELFVSELLCFVYNVHVN